MARYNGGIIGRPLTPTAGGASGSWSLKENHTLVTTSKYPIANLTPNFQLDLDATTTLPGVITFTRSSTAAYTNSTGKIVFAGSGAARFDYDPNTLQNRGLYIEQQSVNLAIASDLINATNWGSQFGSITGNTAVAPDGTMTAAKIKTNSGNSGGGGFGLHYPPHASAGTGAYVQLNRPFCVSVYAKADDWKRLAMRLYDGTKYGLHITWDLVTGTVVYGDAAALASGMYYVGNGWWRCWASAITGASGVNDVSVECHNRSIGQSPETNDYYSSTPTLPTTMTGNEGIFIWGYQFEQGVTTPSSYIRNNTKPGSPAAVIRADDVAYVNPISSWINGSQGTMLAEFDVITTTQKFDNAVSNTYHQSYTTVIELDDNTSTGGAPPMIGGTAHGNAHIIAASTVQDSGFGVSYFSACNYMMPAPVLPATIKTVGNTKYRIVATYNSNDYAASRNGGPIAKSNTAYNQGASSAGSNIYTGTAPTAGVTPTYLRLGYSNSGSSPYRNHLHGRIAKFYYWNRRLPDEQVVALSTIS
jgi:hypothetical protein